MKTIHFVEKVIDSQPFKEFIKEDPKAYLCSLFFTRDYEDKKDETQVDFYSPKKNAIVSFKVDKKVERIPLDKKAETITHKKFIPKPLGNIIKMEIDEVKPMLMDEMNNRNIASDINKVLVVLHIADDRVVWNCTGFLKGLGLLQAHLEDESKSVLFMEKKNFLDLLKFVKNVEPGQQESKDSKAKEIGEKLKNALALAGSKKSEDVKKAKSVSKKGFRKKK